MLSAVALLAVAGLDFSEVSGVKVSCLENVRGKAGRARIELVVGAGALHEEEDARGVAHLVEHLLLRPLGFDDSNGATAWDYTSYYRDVRAAELSTAAVDLAAAVAAIDLEANAFPLEREVVLREMELRGSRETSMAIDPIFGATILARDPGGSVESVRDLTAEDVRAFHAKYYVRGNIAVVARGAVSCAELSQTLAPVLARFPEGPAAALPRVTEKEPGPRALPIGYGADAFVQGFYWYDSTIADEMVMRVIAKHLEQLALDELRKAQGLTYSPQGEVTRIGAGGTLRLRVMTEGQESVVGEWYEEKIRELRESSAPVALTQRARTVVEDLLDNDAVRFGLAAIRGEDPPDQALAKLDNAAMAVAIGKLLDPSRAFGSTTPSRNIGSIVVLIAFAAVVLGALGYAGSKMMR